MPEGSLFESLDPPNWENTRKQAYQIVDAAIDHTRDVRDRPVWSDIPEDVRSKFLTAVPEEPMPLGEILDEVKETVLKYPMGNIHPRFWAWYMGSSNFTGAMADFIAAVQGSNLGAGNHVASLIDKQVVSWFRSMIGLPSGSSGTLVSGGSVANLIGLTVARNAIADIDIREEGVAALSKPLRYYCSDQAHSCHQQAVETLGLGNKSLVRIPSQADLTMDLYALKKAVRADRANGLNPSCVIATAGTVNTGAIDDLAAIADFCEVEGLWFHIDGCIGALLAIARENRWRVAGIERADSVALDPHKWMHAPFEVGCALVRDKSTHLRTFSLTPEYLERTTRGLAAAEFLHDYGIQTSRGFRALKVWMSLKEHGLKKFGRLIDQDISKAQYLTRQIEKTRKIDLLFPTNLNIVCFRYDTGDQSEAELKATNTEIMLRLQEEGIAVVSDTTVKNKYCLRAAINNHRTQHNDLELLVSSILRIGAQVSAGT